MTPRLPERSILPSLLDRLIDLEPHNRKETSVVRAQSVREVKDSIRRDLEWLLNTRRTPEMPPRGARELWRSVYTYGLADITGMPLNRPEAQGELARQVENAISAFEPRLRNVRVAMQATAAGTRILRFQIEALLRTEPAPARVFFDTTLELVSGEYDVAGESNAR